MSVNNFAQREERLLNFKTEFDPLCLWCYNTAASKLGWKSLSPDCCCCCCCCWRLSPLLWCSMMLDERAMLWDWEMQPEERMQRTGWVEDCSPAPGHWPSLAADTGQETPESRDNRDSDSGHCTRWPGECTPARCHLWQAAITGAEREKIPTQGFERDPHAQILTL